jgi:probable blue pigment (indigoidine) exporter
VLARRWSDGTPLLAVTAWQLLVGGTVLTIAAGLVEGAPPAIDGPALAGFAFTSLVATAIAYLCWFGGLARLRAATVGVVGLLNPVTGVLLGAAVLGERLTLAQAGGVALVLVGILATTLSRAPSAPRVAAQSVAPPVDLVGARA